MAASPKPWANTPFPLIPMPARATSSTSPTEATSIFIAREMTFAHNGMLRALNSIYLQAPHVKKEGDIKDLLQYTRIWYDWIHEHHDVEEEMLFPALERISGVVGLMERNVEQHEAFLPGLEELGMYVKRTAVGEFDAQKLCGIIDRFGHVLTTHLREEIGTLLELKAYDGVALKKAYLEFDEKLRDGEKDALYPIVFGTGDVDYDNEEWPVVPGFVRYLVHYWFERKYQGSWRFSPSTTWGVRRPLLFLEDE